MLEYTKESKLNNEIIDEDEQVDHCSNQRHRQDLF